MVKSLLGWGPSFNDFVSVTSNLMKFVSLRFVLPLLSVSLCLSPSMVLSVSLSLSLVLFLFRFCVFALCQLLCNREFCEKRHSNDLGVVATALPLPSSPPYHPVVAACLAWSLARWEHPVRNAGGRF